MAPPPSRYDLIVIGAGPGGYVAALRAAQLGLRVACVEKSPTLGGTCLNVGCIPSKALLTSSHLFEQAAHHLAVHGIRVPEPVVCDVGTLMRRKDKVVADNTKGIEFLFKKNKVDWIKGTAVVRAPGKVEVGGTTYEAQNILIATGSETLPLAGVKIDEKRICSSTGALSLPSVPASLAVIGAGVIGLELGSVWRRLGAQVTVVEYLDRILPGMDRGVSTHFQRILTKQGFTFHLGTKVTGATVSGNRVRLSLHTATAGGAEMPPQTLEADVVLVAIGRRAYTQGLGLDAVGVALDSRGRIQTDAHFATTVPGIYAIGDVIAGPMLAHKAEEEGVAVAEILAGQAGHVNYHAIPSVIYTSPEVASVGQTEEELKEAGADYTVGQFPFTANGRARAMDETEGFVKLLACRKTDRLLGAHIIGPEAGTLIAEVTLAMEFGASAEDIARTCHAHPTLSEAIREAALATAHRALHI